MSSINSISSVNIKNIFKNDNLTNLVILLTIILIVGYLTNKNYDAIVFLFVSSCLLFLLCKNIVYSLTISIILTNLLITLDYIKISEGFKESMKKKKESMRNKKKKNNNNNNNNNNSNNSNSNNNSNSSNSSNNSSRDLKSKYKINK